jgi:glutaminyl-tRNA synthetase
MKQGKWPNGAKSVRARIDLASPNFNLRDPVMYRIVHEEHHNTGAAWCIYPMYDWAHGFEDSLEGHHPLRSARWSSRITAPSTTGSSMR